MIKFTKKEIPFKEFLDKSTNLITVFGIFNALFIYSNSIDINEAGQFLVPTFYLLSLLVWIEIIIFSLKSSNEDWRYETFYILACMILVGLTWYFISTFGAMILVLGISLLPLLLLYLIIRLCIYMVSRLAHKLNYRMTKFINFSIIIIGFIITFLILKFGLPIIKSSVQKKESTQSRTKNYPVSVSSIKTNSNELLRRVDSLDIDTNKIDLNRKK